MRAALASVALVLFTACPGNEQGDVSQNDPAKTTTSTQNVNAAPENSTAMNPVTPPQQELPGNRLPGSAPAPQDVHLIEYAIHMPDTLPAGEVRFKVANGGKEVHSFAIEGPGVATKLANDLTRGNSSEVNVKLQPGTYTVYCPIEGHRGKGMEKVVTVRP